MIPLPLLVSLIMTAEPPKEKLVRICAGGGPKGPSLPRPVQAPLQGRRLTIAERPPLAPVLVKELADFRVKVTLAGNETFEAWRERDHDDLMVPSPVGKSPRCSRRTTPGE